MSEAVRGVVQRRLRLPSSRRRARCGPSLPLKSGSLQNHFLHALEERPRPSFDVRSQRRLSFSLRVAVDHMRGFPVSSGVPGNP